MWGEHEKAVHCYRTKALSLKYQITAHRLWHVAKEVCHPTVYKSAAKGRRIADNSLSQIEWYYTMEQLVQPIYLLCISKQNTCFLPLGLGLA